MASIKQPNILFFLPDQHRFDFLGTNAALPVRTPNIDKLASHGVLFSSALCPSPLCAPSRACLASGKSYHRCGVVNNGDDYPIEQPTYYTALRDAGYQVAGVGKFDLHKNTLDWGLDGSRLLHDWGFSEGIDNEGKYDAIRSGADVPKGPYMAYLHERGLAEIHVNDFRNRHGYKDTYPTPLPEEAYCDNWVANNGIRLLKAFPKDRPWHLVINFTGPHNPMDVTQAMRERWKDVDFPPPNDNNQWDAATHRRIRQNYAAMVENIDRHVGRFLEEVEVRGELDNTLIIYSSDHGEMLGDHNRWAKGTYYQPSVGIPMIVAGPKVTQDLRSDALVSLHDLTATILDYAGVEALPEMDSLSLRDVLEGRQSAHREFVVSGLNDWQSVYDGRYKLVLGQNAEPILFDLLNDPSENVNIAGDAETEVARLKRLV
ncbi:MAG: sulfatase-like hydrolase/transferase [Deltaproteobacteria bacterium]|nr:sulfatase-like hydrolase/transferase [Deltaproteobacteria bacterium]